MGERPPFLEGGNLALVVLLTLLLLGAGLLWIGPGSGHLESARAELSERLERSAEWHAQNASAAPISEAEREQWNRSFERLRDHGAVVEDEPALMAHVAGAFRAPSVRHLEVTRRSPPESEEEPEEEAGLRIEAPFTEEAAELYSVPLHVAFGASFTDASEILARLESESSPASIERLEMRRDFPGVRVEIDLLVWTRREVAS
jgi:hypothetical protein